MARVRLSQIELPPFQRAATFAPASIDKEKRTVDLVFSTGARTVKTDIWSGQRYIETLSLKRGHVRMDRLKSGTAPFLAAHNGFDLDAVVGVVETAALDGEQGTARVRFATGDPAADRAWNKVEQGILKNASVGYRVHKFEQTEGKDGALPERRAVDWEPFEISLVPMGADPGAHLRTATDELQPCMLTRMTEETMDDKPPITPPIPPDQAALEAARVAGVEAERVRIDAIRSIVAKAKLESAIADDLVKRGVTLDETRRIVLDKLATQSDALAPKPGGVAVVTDDNRDKWLRAAEAAIFMRSGVASLIEAAAKKRGETHRVDPGEYRGYRMVDLARESLERCGISTRGLSMDRMVSQAMVGGSDLALRAGGQTTSDFAVLMENALHKTLLASYEITPDTWSLFCAVGSVTDFRPHIRIRRGTFGRLDVVGESGEFTNKAIPDGAKETIQAATRGNIIALTRQAIINDDLSAFADLAVMFGRAAALSIEMDAYDTLLLNGGLGPTMQDGVSLFHANHNNVSTGAALSIAAIDADRVVMASQRDPSSNEILDLRPGVLVLPVGLGGQARAVNGAQYDFDQTNKFMKPNVVMGLFQTIVDTPRLSGTRRYLFASPTIAPTLEVFFLNGERSPMLETRDGWRVDGVEMKVRLDYGVDGVDWRGAVTNAGV